MAEIAYQDFDLSLDKAPEGFRATVRASPAGSASSDFVLPFDTVKLENYILRLGRVRRGVRRIDSPESLAAREFGGALFQAVFTGEVRACLRSSLDDTLRRDEGLRLRLRVNAPELWGLPWEFLYYPTRNQFLALSVHSPLVRYIELAEPVPVLAVDPPLRVLAMISSPSDHPPLDVEREWRLLNDAVGTLHPARRVVLERLHEPTLSALQRRLRRHDYHVFHFIGHGGYDQEKDEGVLLLEDEDHKGDVVSSRHLGMLLHDHRPLRVAVLNACEGARASRSAMRWRRPSRRSSTARSRTATRSTPR
jgi:CHAT domain